MNWNQLLGIWKQAKGGMLQLWGRLTGDEFSMMMGKRESIDGKILKSYGDNTARADKHLGDWQAQQKSLR